MKNGGRLSVLSDTYVRTHSITVEFNGSFVSGTRQSPVENVTVYLDHDNCTSEWDNNDKSGTDGQMTEAEAGENECLKNGTFTSRGFVTIFGVKMTSWTTLTSSASAGDTSVHVRRCEGWRDSDTVIIAPSEASDPAFETTIKII